MNVEEALARLDPANDEHWTADGMPKVETVSALMGQAASRRQITDAAPGFTRASARGEGVPGDGTQEPEAAPPTEAPQKAPEQPQAPLEPGPKEAPETRGATPSEAELPSEPEAPSLDPGPLREHPGTGRRMEPTELREGEVGELLDPVLSDPDWAAYVEPHDEVVGMTPQQVYSDVDLVDRAIEEFNRQTTVLTARREAIFAKLKEVGRRGALLDTVRNRMTLKGACTRTAKALRDYQDTQAAVREKKAARARRFIEAGTTAADVRGQLDGRSAIDAAMGHRKSARGAARPIRPMTADAET